MGQWKPQYIFNSLEKLSEYKSIRTAAALDLTSKGIENSLNLGSQLGIPTAASEDTTGSSKSLTEKW